MDYNTLLDFTVDLGYRLAMSGAETFRIEESISLVLGTYGIASETFAIPNCLTVSITTPDGRPMTRMRRIGYHGNDLDSVERYSNLSRRVCAEKPDPKDAVQMLKAVDSSRVRYSYALYLLGNFLGGAGYAVFFGGSLLDGICGGICGVLVGIINHSMDKLHANQFFRTILASFFMAFLAYAMGILKIAHNSDTVIIGALMILVPGLLFTNAMRDIIYGDTNSGTNRIVQVFLIAAAIALGTAAAWNSVQYIWETPQTLAVLDHSMLIQLTACFIGCIGFSILFNIHGPGMILCAFGGLLAWGVYCLSFHFEGSDLTAYFWAAVVSGIYSETMARIRKYPAISYLVVAIFPLIPGASVYYTMNYAVRGENAAFADKGLHTIAIAGVIAVGILIVSTTFRIWTMYKRNKLTKKDAEN